MSFNEIKNKSKASLKGKYGDSILLFIISFAISFGAAFVLGFVLAPINLSEQSISVVGDLLSIVISGFLQFGTISYFLKVSRNEPVTYKELFSKTNLFFVFIGLYFLVGIVTMLWTLLLIIPGIIAAIDYSLVYFIKLDNPNLGILEVMKKSKAMMKGHRNQYLGLILGFLAYLVLGAFTLGILYIWLIPLINVMLANFYNSLLANNGMHVGDGNNIPVAPNAYGQQPMNNQQQMPVQTFCAYCGAARNDGQFCKSCGGKY